MALPTALVGALVMLAAADDTSLIQHQLDVKGVAERSRGSCECLNWKSTYQSGKVKCGNANEYFSALTSAAKAHHKTLKSTKEVRGFVQTTFGIDGTFVDTSLVDTMCHNFYEIIDDNVCVNIDNGLPKGVWFAQQWCYVSSECDDLNGGKAVTDGTPTADSMRGANEIVHPTGDSSQAKDGLAWKVCTGKKDQGTDRLLREMDVPELAAFSKTNQLDAIQLIRSAYFLQSYSNLTQSPGKPSLSDSHSLQDNPQVQQRNVPVVYELEPLQKYHIVNVAKNWLIQIKPEFLNGTRNRAEVPVSEWHLIERLS